jgi:hypothetical protein
MTVYRRRLLIERPEQMAPRQYALACRFTISNLDLQFPLTPAFHSIRRSRLNVLTGLVAKLATMILPMMCSTLISVVCTT